MEGEGRGGVTAGGGPNADAACMQKGLPQIPKHLRQPGCRSNAGLLIRPERKP